MRESRGEKTRRLFAGVFPVLYRSPYYYTVLVVCTELYRIHAGRPGRRRRVAGRGGAPGRARLKDASRAHERHVVHAGTEREREGRYALALTLFSSVYIYNKNATMYQNELKPKHHESDRHAQQCSSGWLYSGPSVHSFWAHAPCPQHLVGVRIRARARARARVGAGVRAGVRARARVRNRVRQHQPRRT